MKMPNLIKPKPFAFCEEKKPMKRISENKNTNSLTPKEFNLWLLQIEFDETNARNMRTADADGSPGMVEYKILGGVYSVARTEEALSTFYQSVKNNKGALCHPLPREQYKKQVESMETRRDFGGWEDEYLSVVEKIGGQARYIPPKQEGLLDLCGRKKWPKPTYTGKVGKMRKKGKAKCLKA